MRSSLALFVFLATQPPAPGTPIQLHLLTHVCAAPCTITATVSIPKHRDNRLASVVWGYADADSTQWDVGSATQQVEFTIQIKNLEKGDHRIYAVLLRERVGEPQTFEDSQEVSVH